MRQLGLRLASVAGVLFGITVVAFGLLSLIPGDAAQAMLGIKATAADVAQLREKLGLDGPLVERYVRWLVRVLHGDLGTSISHEAPIVSLIAERAVNTAMLAFGSLLVAMGIGVPCGIASARRAGGPWDKVVLTGSLFGTSMPVFWTGIMAISLFSVLLGWLPSGGTYDLGAGPSVSQYLRHLILPVTVLGVSSIGVIARLTRSALLEVLEQDFLRAARAKGLGERVVVWRHALRSASLPIVTIGGAQVGYLLSGAVLTETVFAWPGLGRLMFEAIGTRDYPVVLGGLIISAVIVTLVNLAVDLLYLALDPRMRHVH